LNKKKLPAAVSDQYWKTVKKYLRPFVIEASVIVTCEQMGGKSRMGGMFPASLTDWQKNESDPTKGLFQLFSIPDFRRFNPNDNNILFAGKRN